MYLTSNSSINVNKFSLLCLLAFIFFSIVFRVLLPFGDEPDFIVRAPRFVLTPPDYIPNFVYLFSSQMDYISTCNSNAEFIALLGAIEYNSCVQNSEQIFIRLALQFLLMSFPFLFLCIRKPLYFVFKNEDRHVVDKKLDSLSINYLFSGFLIYFGIIGYEQFLLLISSWVFLFFRSYLLLASLILWIFLIDVGDSIVVIYSVFLLFTFRFITVKFSLKTTVLTCVIIIFITFVFSTVLVYLVGMVSFFSDKANSISLAYETTDIQDKYPIYLRPGITFMTLVMLLPSGIKSVLGISASFIFSFRLMVYAYINRYKSDLEAWLYILVIVTVVISVIFVLPGYANGKYYIFMMPMFFYFALTFFNKINVLYTIICINVLCVLDLTLSYLNY